MLAQTPAHLRCYDRFTHSAHAFFRDAILGPAPDSQLKPSELAATWPGAIIASPARFVKSYRRSAQVPSARRSFIAVARSPVSSMQERFRPRSRRAADEASLIV